MRAQVGGDSSDRELSSYRGVEVAQEGQDGEEVFVEDEQTSVGTSIEGVTDLCKEDGSDDGEEEDEEE